MGSWNHFRAREAVAFKELLPAQDVIDREALLAGLDNAVANRVGFGSLLRLFGGGNGRQGFWRWFRPAFATRRIAKM